MPSELVPLLPEWNFQPQSTAYLQLANYAAAIREILEASGPPKSVRNKLLTQLPRCSG